MAMTSGSVEAREFSMDENVHGCPEAFCRYGRHPRERAAETRSAHFPFNVNSNKYSDCRPHPIPNAVPMPGRLHLPFLSCRNSNDRHRGRYQDEEEAREVLGNVGDSCWRSDHAQPRRRRPHLTSSMRTAPDDKPSPALSSWAGLDSGEFLPIHSSRKVRVSDDELVHRARSASRASQSGRLLRVPSVMWDCKEISGFALLSRRSGANGESFEVLTMGEMNCRPCDLEPLLHPQSESDFNAVARDFLGDQFIYGSIVHDVRSQGFSDNSLEDSDDLELGTAHNSLHLGADDRVAVKTACFARSRRFARNEEWCFLEHYQVTAATPASPSPSFMSSGSSTAMSSDDTPGFKIVMSSIPESELSAGKMESGRVTQLHGILLTYQVEPLAQTVGCRVPRVRVSFHATFDGAEPTGEGYADSQTVRERLMSMARSLHRLPELVKQRQRQLSQVSPHDGLGSDLNEEYRNKHEAQNSRCIICTRRLRMRLLSTPTRRSKRCQICWYKACGSCWSKQNVSTFNGHSTSMIVCRRCHENLGSSEYSHIQLTC